MYKYTCEWCGRATQNMAANAKYHRGTCRGRARRHAAASKRYLKYYSMAALPPKD